MPLSLDEISQIALERLEESRDHEEQWDFLFATHGSQEIIYLPHDTVQDWEFEPEEWGWFEIADARREDIQAGDAPDESELKSWKLNRALNLMRRGSTECSQAFIVPILVADKVQGYAVIDCGIMDRDPDFEPWLVDVFHTNDDAHAAIERLGLTSRASTL